MPGGLCVGNLCASLEQVDGDVLAVGKLGCAGRSDLFRHACVLGLLDELEASRAPLAY